MNHRPSQTWKGLQAIPEDIIFLFCACVCVAREEYMVEQHPNAPLPAWQAQGLSDSSVPAAVGEAQEHTPRDVRISGPARVPIVRLGAGPSPGGRCPLQISLTSYNSGSSVVSVHISD